ncbi:MAG: hypothetical protein IJY20_07725 [Clostridia bacterium]|nr:hypothetical protein [Clostridia bacterium]
MIKPAFIFTDHAVLQRGKPVPVWGECDCDSLIVSFAGNSVPAEVRDGRFEATLPAMQAGTRGELRFVSDSETLALSDVVVGEVWLAGGQSNMEHPVFCTEYDASLVADDPDLRLFTVPRRTCYTGETWGFHFEEMQAEETPWQPCTKDSALSFTAIGYFFAVRLRKELHVPVGIVSCNWGATLVENWTSERYLAADPLTRRALAHDAALPAKDAPAVLAEHAAYQAAMKEFCLSYNAKALVEEQGVHHYLRHCGPNIPCSEAAALYRRPGVLRESMLARVTPYALRGVIWHQGESNGRADYPDCKEWYKALFHAMMADWREAFRAPELPFYLVQLAGCNLDGAQKETWVPVRTAQEELGREPGCRTVISYDLSEADNIHPAQKQKMGERLADAALDGEYSIEKPWQSPTLAGCVKQGDTVTLTFANATRLVADADQVPAGLFLYREDGTSYEVSCRPEGNTIRFIIPEGDSAVAVGYGRRNYSRANMLNERNLPVTPFYVGLK